MIVPTPFSTPEGFLNTKVQINDTLFDVLLDNTLAPIVIDTKTEQHNHSAYEFHYVISGSGTLRLGETDHPYQAGSMHLIAPHVFHSIQPNGGQPLEQMICYLTLDSGHPTIPWYPTVETERIRLAFNQVTYLNLTASDAVHQGKLLQILQEIHHEIKHPTLCSFTVIHSLLTQLIICLVRCIPHKQNEIAYIFPKKTKDELRSLIIDIFYSQFKEDLKIEMLASLLHLSTKQINRLIMQFFKTSFKQKLIDTRMEVAKDLLRSTRYPVSRIAEEVGYASTQHFCQMFKRKTGLSPTQYRSHACNPNYPDSRKSDIHPSSLV